MHQTQVLERPSITPTQVLEDYIQQTQVLEYHTHQTQVLE